MIGNSVQIPSLSKKNELTKGALAVCMAQRKNVLVPSPIAYPYALSGDSSVATRRTVRSTCSDSVSTCTVLVQYRYIRTQYCTEYSVLSTQYAVLMASTATQLYTFCTEYCTRVQVRTVRVVYRTVIVQSVLEYYKYGVLRIESASPRVGTGTCTSTVLLQYKYSTSTGTDLGRSIIRLQDCVTYRYGIYESLYSPVYLH